MYLEKVKSAQKAWIAYVVISIFVSIATVGFFFLPGILVGNMDFKLEWLLNWWTQDITHIVGIVIYGLFIIAVSIAWLVAFIKTCIAASIPVQSGKGVTIAGIILLFIIPLIGFILVLVGLSQIKRAVITGQFTYSPNMYYQQGQYNPMNNPNFRNNAQYNGQNQGFNNDPYFKG
ncbi:hypothetical protein [Mycoplasma seminis]|uniref:Uncharacterized protein n=1 Tax=Mycoplasma seminis TaxID=512749 RepID=A0ABY9H9W7_9MOLU|nr:hypothetical protein [Mycoplasma seminis]WLP85389.1 hypothetical protein Q8852_03650 [Mycoplasma seminis]